MKAKSTLTSILLVLVLSQILLVLLALVAFILWTEMACQAGPFVA